MTSTHEALVRRSLDEIRQQLQDPDRVLSALPGAALTRDHDGASGSLKLKLGEIQITYRVTIRATGAEGGAHAAIIAVAGKEARGGGTLAATIDVQLHDVEDGTLLQAVLDLTATGRGESVSDTAWAQAAETLLAGAVSALTDITADDVAADDVGPDDVGPADVAPAPAPTPRPVPLVDVSSRPLAAAPATRSPGPSPQHVAAVAGVLLVLLVVLGRRRRRR